MVEIFLCDVDGELAELFVLLLCFSSPRQRPLSAAHPARPQPVPSVYWDSHRALRGSNKGGSVPIVPPGTLKPLSGHRPNPELGVAREAGKGGLTSSVLQRG